MTDFIYKGSKAKEISFPLGGIGAGCIGLSGNGRLIDWEIFNKPNKDSINGYSFFSIKVESMDEVLDARVLQGDLQGPYSGSFRNRNYHGIGFGPYRYSMAGIPHFTDVEFEGMYPFARVGLQEAGFPGDVKITAYNPFIPLNDKDSSIPGAFFEIEVVSNLDKPATYTVALSLTNPLPTGTGVNKYVTTSGLHLLRFMTDKEEIDDPGYGDLCIATDAEYISYQEYWFRGSWFDNLQTYWKEFNLPGKLKNRSYPFDQRIVRSDPNDNDVGTLAAHITMAPGEKKKVRFIITWNFPNCTNYWNPEKCEEDSCCCNNSKPKIWKNYYASVFQNSMDTAIYSLTNWNRLYRDSLLFKNTLFSSTIPVPVLDAVSANMSILKTPTCLRLEDGSFYGFEGCHCTAGCCEGSCTHVWNYAYALPFLFPKLERSMRDLDFRYNQREDGGMSFRLQLPPGRERKKFRPCADGQFGGVIKTYRDWKISGDTLWLKSNWEAVKKSIEFAWAPTNEDRWDFDRDGVLEGRQHHTLDMELFGPNSWLTGFYLAALKAGAEMAECLEEADKAKQYMDLFVKGKQWVDEKLFNGEYYQQLIDLKDRDLLAEYDVIPLQGDSAVDIYWHEEAKEIKYQVGEGCSIDQVLAQWHANLCGLGEIFDKVKVKKALKSIYKNNFKKTMRDYFNPCRLYSLNDEGGVAICTWPDGKCKPAISAPYSEETWSGCEYQVAAHMIQEGLIDEAVEIVQAVRNRYDGENRNPWNEFECGSNYSRSMASYSLVNAFSGFEFDMVKGMIGFNPARVVNGEFSSFWSVDSGWGLFEMKPRHLQIKVLYGELNIKTIKPPSILRENISLVSKDSDAVHFESKGEFIKLFSSIKIAAGESLMINART